MLEISRTTLGTVIVKNTTTGRSKRYRNLTSVLVETLPTSGPITQIHVNWTNGGVTFTVAEISKVNGATAPALADDLALLLSETVFNFGGATGAGVGTVISVADVMPVNGNVPLTASNIGAVPLRTETISYLNLQKAKGAKVDILTVNAIDAFFSDIEPSGALSLFKTNGEIGGGLGDNLAASLTKLLPGVGLATSLVNENFVEADYDKRMGYKLTTNTNKRLLTGFVPSTQGLNYLNISFGGMIVDDSPISVNIIGDNNVATIPTLSFSAQQMGLSGYYAARAGGAEIMGVSYGVTESFAARWGVLTFYTGQSQSYNTLATEVTLFSSKSNNTQQYSTGSLGFYWICPTLSRAQLAAVNNAIEKLMITIGRLNNIGPIAKFRGDSNMQGLGVNNNYDKASSIIARNIGARQRNYGSGGARQIADNFGQSFGAITTLPYANYPYANYRFICIGTNDELQDGDANNVGTPATIAAYKAALDNEVKAAITLRENVVLITTPYNDNPTTNQTKTKAYNTAMKEVALANNVRLANMYQRMIDTASPLAYLQTDKLHLNEAGHLMQANVVLDILSGKITRDITFDSGAIAANTYVDVVFGDFLTAKVGQTVTVAPFSPVAGLSYMQSFVNAADSVTLRIWNLTGATITPGSKTARISVNIN